MHIRVVAVGSAMTLLACSGGSAKVASLHWTEVHVRSETRVELSYPPDEYRSESC